MDKVKNVDKVKQRKAKRGQKKKGVWGRKRGRERMEARICYESVDNEEGED